MNRRYLASGIALSLVISFALKGGAAGIRPGTSVWVHGPRRHEYPATVTGIDPGGKIELNDSPDLLVDESTLTPEVDELDGIRARNDVQFDGANYAVVHVYADGTVELRPLNAPVGTPLVVAQISALRPVTAVSTQRLCSVAAADASVVPENERDPSTMSPAEIQALTARLVGEARLLRRIARPCPGPQGNFEALADRLEIRADEIEERWEELNPGEVARSLAITGAVGLSIEGLLDPGRAVEEGSGRIPSPLSSSVPQAPLQ